MTRLREGSAFRWTQSRQAADDTTQTGSYLRSTPEAGSNNRRSGHASPGRIHRSCRPRRSRGDRNRLRTSQQLPVRAALHVQRQNDPGKDLPITLTAVGPISGRGTARLIEHQKTTLGTFRLRKGNIQVRFIHGPTNAHPGPRQVQSYHRRPRHLHHHRRNRSLRRRDRQRHLHRGASPRRPTNRSREVPRSTTRHTAIRHRQSGHGRNHQPSLILGPLRASCDVCRRSAMTPSQLQRWSSSRAGTESSESAFAHRRSRRGWMEHLWSRADATEGNRARIGPPRKRLKQAESVAADCR